MQDFKIKGTILTRYTGTDANVVIPDGVTQIRSNAFRLCDNLTTITIPDSVTEIGRNAFFQCDNLTTITIPDGVTSIGSSAFHGCSNLTSITIPDGVTSIGNWAFYECSNLTSIKIPDGVTSIGDSTFYKCGNLATITIPDSVTTIGHSAFSGCKSLTSITIPDGITSIESEAFSGCSKLTSIKIPNGVTTIGSKAFANCSSLTDIEIPDIVTSIADGAFTGCSNLQLDTPELLSRLIGLGCFPENAKTPIPKTVWQEKIQVPPRFAEYTSVDNAEDYAYIALYQTKDRWSDWCAQNDTWLGEALPHIIRLLSGEKKVAPKMAKRLLRLAENAAETMDKNLLVDMLKATEARSNAATKALIQQHLNGMASHPDGHPIEAYAAEALKTCSIRAEVSSVVKTGISYADGTGKCTATTLALLIELYAREWDTRSTIIHGQMGPVEMLQYGSTLRASTTADTIADALDRKQLLDVLRKQLHGTKYRLFLLAYARYADDKEVETLSAEIAKKAKGTKKERYWADNCLKALFLNECPTTMRLFDKKEMLDAYAMARGTTAVVLRNTAMLPDIGLSNEGTKNYVLGENHYEARLTPNLTLELYDTVHQKTIRSIPKKNVDVTQAKAIQDDFTALKKTVKQFIAERSEQLCQMHVSGEAMPQDLWRRVYIKNPVLYRLAERVVWADKSNHSFALVEKRPVTANHDPFEPCGSIHVAHVLEMQEEKIQAWRQFLTQLNRSELFEQVWEPVLHNRIRTLKTYYEGATLTSAERNALKKNLKQRGINVRSDEIYKEYDHRAGQYVFSNWNTMHLGSSVSIEYCVDADTKEITFGKAKTTLKNEKELNAIILELNKVSMLHHIRNDRGEYLTQELLDLFSAAQINEFVDFAISSNAVDCTAILLEYKNKNHAQYNEMDMFVLDW